MMAMDKKTNSMTLSDLLSPWLNVPANMDCEVSGISQDSRSIKNGDVFLACKGQTVNGVAYIDSAIEQGAQVVIWQAEEDTAPISFSSKKSKQGRNVVLVAMPDLLEQAGLIAAQFYHFPSQQLFVTGITGTNGKTSCSHFLAQALNETEVTGLIGTLGNGLYGHLETATHTTPDAVTCQQWMADMLSDGANNVAMEVSSHALDQNRVSGVEFDCAVFTNLTRDHLDYHGDMESYLSSKLKLFQNTSLKFAVINNDDAAAEKIRHVIAENVRVISYGLDNKADVFAHDICFTHEGISMTVETPWGSGDLKTSLLGKFNISNLLAVLSVLLLKDIPLENALSRLARLKGVTGRMHCLQVQGKPLVVIDYAHTPDALGQVLSALQEHQHDNIWCVFGCGGDRDKGKRSIMGTVAESLSDRVVITTDNPRSEDPQSIADDICDGVANLSQVDVVLDRAEAIEFAVTHATEQDIVLIAGKGHETYQEVNGVRYPFNDEEVATRYLGVNGEVLA